MARINLLPWRAGRRRQRQLEFVMMMVASALIGLLVAFGIIQYFNNRISAQQDRNTTLQKEITELDKQIRTIEGLETKKAELLARKQVIEQLQASRSQMVHLFDELVRTIPEGVQLSSIKQTGSQLTLDGFAQSNARVSMYMTNLDKSEWLTKPEIGVIEAKGDNKALPYVFSLKVTMTKPGADKATEEGLDDTTGGAR